MGGRWCVLVRPSRRDLGLINWETFHFILGEIEDLITKETTRFKEPTTPGCQLALTLYMYTVEWPMEAWWSVWCCSKPAYQICKQVTSSIVEWLDDRFVFLPRSEEEWGDEGSGFHIRHISSNLKKFLQL